MNWYKLDDSLNPVKVDSGGVADAYFAWHAAMPESADWYVQKTGVGFQLAVDYIDGLRISTVFMGMDHNWTGGPPVLWETMVFHDGGDRANLDLYQDRYTSHDDAVDGHRRICRLVASEGAEALANRSA